MDLPDLEMKRQYSIIGRPRKQRSQQYRPEQVASEISQHLSLHGIYENISYLQPNLIISLNNPHQQRQILACSPVTTSDFVIDLLPWSREHEFAQMPWIIDAADNDSAIIIDPLTILPVARAHKKEKGTHVLHDQFASTLNVAYDLRAPDYSYIALDAIIDLYHAKHSAIQRCKQIISHIRPLMQQFYPQLQSITEAACSRLQVLQSSEANTPTKSIYDELIHYLRNAKDHAIVETPAIIELLHAIQDLPNRYVNLDNFRTIPSLLKVPVTDSYTKRLKQIHAAAMKQVYGNEAIVTTTETAKGRFQTYITIRDQTYRYREIPLKTTATIEAIAIYESLRYITNVLGYKIIDLNHDTLATVVSAINNYNADIVLLQSYISAITTETEDIYEGFLQLENLFIIEPWSTTNSPADFTRLINPIIAAVQHHHTAIKNIFDEFTSSKIQYLSTYIESESPTAVPSRWIPTLMQNNPQDEAATSADPAAPTNL